MRLSQHCYLISGLSVEPPWSVNAGFIVGQHTTLIVDTGSNYLSAQTIFGYALCAKPNNKLMVVNTEPHFDHIGGNGFFIDQGIDVYAHPGVKRRYEEFQQNKEDFNNTIPNEVRRSKNEAEVFFYKTELTNPNKAILQNDIIELGDVNAAMLSTPGHTQQNISIFVTLDGVLYCGDCIVTGYIPNLEAGNSTDWETWLRSIEIIKKLKPHTIVPGHGYTLTEPEQIERELNTMEVILNKAIEDNKAPTR